MKSKLTRSVLYMQPSQKRVIERAARAQGLTASAFMRQASLKAAQEASNGQEVDVARAS